MPDLDAVEEPAAGLAVRRESGMLMLVLSGELDLTNVDSIRAGLDAALAEQHDQVAFDLSGLRFMDSSGIALMLSVARQVGGSIELRDAGPIIRRLIELTGLESVLQLMP